MNYNLVADSVSPAHALRDGRGGDDVPSLLYLDRRPAEGSRHVGKVVCVLVSLQPVVDQGSLPLFQT